MPKKAYGILLYSSQNVWYIQRVVVQQKLKKLLSMKLMQHELQSANLMIQRSWLRLIVSQDLDPIIIGKQARAGEYWNSWGTEREDYQTK